MVQHGAWAAGTFRCGCYGIYDAGCITRSDKSLIENLVKALTEDEKTGAAYARQLPNENCSLSRNTQDLLIIRTDQL